MLINKSICSEKKKDDVKLECQDGLDRQIWSKVDFVVAKSDKIGVSVGLVNVDSSGDAARVRARSGLEDFDVHDTIRLTSDAKRAIQSILIATSTI